MTTLPTKTTRTEKLTKKKTAITATLANTHKKYKQQILMKTRKHENEQKKKRIPLE